MPTRTSTRQAAVKANKAFNQGAGTKRRGSSSSQIPPKKGKKDVKPNEAHNYQKPTVTEEAQETKPSDDSTKAQGTVNKQPTEAPPEENAEPAEQEGVNEEKEADKKEEPEKTVNGAAAGEEEEKKEPQSNDSHTAIKVSSEREDAIPSSILEKGIVYFFFRPRVNVEDPHSINDVARSFFVLRPTPKGAKIEDGLIGDDTANCRLLVLPKKRYPASGRERDMGFVEKAKVPLKTIRESLMTETTYETKTRGERTRPEARPYAEGVYAIVKEGRNSHLAYILTIPRQMGDLQTDFGLHGRGSFIMQSKNPEYPGPPIAQLPQGPEYPEQVQEKFKGYRWIPTEPEFLDYSNAQFLMIGEAHGDLGKAGEAHIDDKDDKDTKKDPAQELEQLEGENEERVDSLSGDHSIFEDLGAQAKKHESVPSDWE